MYCCTVNNVHKKLLKKCEVKHNYKKISESQTALIILKWYYDQKIISFFSSDFESVFA